MTAPFPVAPPPGSTRHRPFAGVGWLLAGLTVRRWAVALGTTRSGLVRGGVTSLMIAALVGATAGARWRPGFAAAGSSATAEAVLLVIALVVWAVAAGFGVFAAHAAAPPPPLAFLRTLPVSDRQARRAAALPLGTVITVAVLASGPLVLRGTTTATGRGAVGATVLLGLLAAAGTALGVVLHRAAGAVAADGRLLSLRLTVAYLGWTAAVVASLAAPLALLRATGTTAGLLPLAPLGWVLAWWALVDPQPAVVAGAWATTAILVGGAAVTSPRTSRGERRRPSVRLLDLSGPLVLPRVQARRLVRHPRVVEGLVVAAFFSLLLSALAGWVARRLPGALGPSVVALLGAQLAAAPAALARGLSDRRRPVEASLGVDAAAHVGSLYVAGGTLAVAMSAPALLVAAALLPASAPALWLVALPLLVAIAVAVSVALTPALGAGAAEGGALLAYAGTSTVALTLLDRLPPFAALPAGAALTVVALVSALALEHAHRRPT